MKRVFSSNEEVCHIWAQQTQSEGRASSIFFRDSVIFSYGEHYPMAKIHTVKGKRVALINSKHVSVTTEQHKSEVRSSLRDLMPYFSSPDIYNLKAALQCNDERAKGSVLLPLKRIKVVSEESIKREFQCILEAYKTANELRKLMGRATISPKKKDLDAVEAHLRKRLARYRELNTPEMLVHKAQQRDKRQALQEQREHMLLGEAIQTFRDRGIRHNSLHRLGYDLLRIEGESVVTSRGAVVPLPEAQMLYRAIISGKHVQGERCGSYTVNAVESCVNPDWQDDKRIRIGCHTFLLSEAHKVLGAA
jgi:hypothetical protein